MPIHGKITHWNRQKAFGFITPESGDNVFVHVRAFVNRDHRPAINQRVTFEMSTDRQGRPCAARVRLLGEADSTPTIHGGARFYIAGAIGFLLIVLACALTGTLPYAVLWFYLATSAVSYLLYAWDKGSAQRGLWRTQESSLHLVDLLGGWPGAMIAQQVLRHKSKKEEFRFVFWLTVIFNCVAFALLFTDFGRSVLESVIS